MSNNNDLNRRMAQLMGFVWKGYWHEPGKTAGTGWHMDWHPTENIADAFRVVDRFLGYELVKSTTEPKIKYRCKIWYDNGGCLPVNTGFVWSDTPCKAICLAAAKAMENR